MEEIIKVHLENEMDLILANKRTMKLAELCNLSLTVQTALATAVSEIARCAMSKDSKAFLKLGISTLPTNKKLISAVICNTIETCGNTEAFSFAKRLITEVRVIKQTGTSYDVQLNQDIRFGTLITPEKIASFVEYFKTEPSLSPYDEIRRKSIQLLELSEKIRESEHQYRQLAETLPLMMFAANPEGEMIYSNLWLKNYFGDGLTTGIPFSEQTLVHPDDYEALASIWSTSFTSGQSFHAQGRLKNKNTGTYLWHLISILPVMNEQNTIIQWTGFFVDINAQKIVEETLKDNVELKEAKRNLVVNQNQLEKKINELNVSNSELEQFAYIASHDLQEPLRKIATFSILLGENLPDLDVQSRTYFDKIIASTDQMTSQIKDVLDWSRIAQTTEEFLLVDLNEVVEHVKRDFEMLILERGATIQKTSDLPAIKGSRSQMIQLFSNLLGNALKFNNTTPVIEIGCRSLSHQEVKTHKSFDALGQYAQVTVSDNGIGFEQQYAQQIFNIFQRLNAHGQFKGTGIGLSICRKIIDNHHGEIYANSEPGRGARFTIILPEMHVTELTSIAISSS